MEDKKLYTTQEVAIILGVSDSHIRRMIGKGKASPAGKVGYIHVFDMAEIERLKNRNKAKGRPSTR